MPAVAAERRPARLGRGQRPRRRPPASATRRPRVLAPTGTIGLMMDCDTTGIEPDLGLCKVKKLVGGGTMSDRQPDGAPCPRPPRLHAGAGRGDRRLHRREQVDPRRAAPGRRARAGVRLLDGRQHHPLLRPRADDGGGAAVHLRRHLQDGEHARGGHRRGGGAAPHRRLAARREGHRHLPRQLQGRPAAVHRQEGGGEGRARRGPRRRRRRAAGGREDRRAGRGEGHQGPHPREAPAQPHLAHLRVPRRRLQGLRHRRRVRRRPARARSSCASRSRAPPSPGSWTPSRCR